MNWIAALIGIFMGISPFLFGYSYQPVAMWNSILIGLALLILGIASAVSSNPYTARIIDWINMLFGIWMVISPFILGYAFVSFAVYNIQVILGLFVTAMEAIAALSIFTPGTPAA